MSSRERICQHPHPAGGLCDACEIKRRVEWHSQQDAGGGNDTD